MSGRYAADDVHATADCSTHEWMDDTGVRETLLHDREGDVVRFALPDGAEWALETSLWELISLYGLVEFGVAGSVVVHMGHHVRVERQSGASRRLDLTTWTARDGDPDGSGSPTAPDRRYTARHRPSWACWRTRSVRSSSGSEHTE